MPQLTTKTQYDEGETSLSPRGPFGARGSSPIVPLLGYAVPIFVLALDYAYFGPIVHFGPFIAWTLAALGMVGLFASRFRDMEPYAAGVWSAFLAGGAVLATALFLVYLPILAVAPSWGLAGIEIGLAGAALAYWTRRHFYMRETRREGWTGGAVAGVALCVALPVTFQFLHEWHFDDRLADLSDVDASVRSRALDSLVRSRFCWNACTRAVCAARNNLDRETVIAVLGTRDVDLTCDDPGMGELGG